MQVIEISDIKVQIFFVEHHEHKCSTVKFWAINTVYIWHMIIIDLVCTDSLSGIC